MSDPLLWLFAAAAAATAAPLIGVPLIGFLRGRRRALMFDAARHAARQLGLGDVTTRGAETVDMRGTLDGLSIEVALQDEERSWFGLTFTATLPTPFSGMIEVGRASSSEPHEREMASDTEVDVYWGTHTLCGPLESVLKSMASRAAAPNIERLFTRHATRLLDVSIREHRCTIMTSMHLGESSRATYLKDREAAGAAIARRISSYASIARGLTWGHHHDAPSFLRRMFDATPHPHLQAELLKVLQRGWPEAETTKGLWAQMRDHGSLDLLHALLEEADDLSLLHKISTHQLMRFASLEAEALDALSAFTRSDILSVAATRLSPTHDVLLRNHEELEFALAWIWMEGGRRDKQIGRYVCHLWREWPARRQTLLEYIRRTRSLAALPLMARLGKDTAFGLNGPTEAPTSDKAPLTFAAIDAACAMSHSGPESRDARLESFIWRMLQRQPVGASDRLVEALGHSGAQKSLRQLTHPHSALSVSSRVLTTTIEQIRAALGGESADGRLTLADDDDAAGQLTLTQSPGDLSIVES